MGTQFFLRWPIQYILCPFSWERCCHSRWTMPLGKNIFGKEALKWTKEPLNCIKSLHRTEPQIWRAGGGGWRKEFIALTSWSVHFAVLEWDSSAKWRHFWCVHVGVCMWVVLKLPWQPLQSMSLQSDLAHLKVDTYIGASHLGSYLDTPEFCSFFLQLSDLGGTEKNQHYLYMR